MLCILVYTVLHRHGPDGQYKRRTTSMLDELLSQLKSTERKEIHQGGTKREQLVDSDPHSLCPYTDYEGNDI